MTAISSAVPEVITLSESMLTAITGNAIMVVILASGFVGLGLRIMRKLFKTSRSVGWYLAAYWYGEKRGKNSPLYL